MANAELQHRRPLGVTIIAVLLGLEGLFELLLGIGVIFGIAALGGAATNHGHGIIGGTVDTLGAIIGSIPLIIGIVTLIFTWALWTLRSWAFWLVVIVEGISLITHVLQLVRHTTSTAHAIVAMIIPVIVLVYFLLDKNVRDAFRVL